MGILAFTLLRATAVGRNGRAPEGTWGRVSTVGLKAGQLSAPGPLHWVPPVSRMLPFGLRLFLFFSGTFALRSPGTPPMVDVPKVIGPDFPVQEAGAWSPGRARGMSGEHCSGWVERILGKIRICGCYCRELQCLTPPCCERQLAHQGSACRISLGDSVTHSWSRY